MVEFEKMSNGFDQGSAIMLGERNWFGKGPDKVYSGYKAGGNNLFQKDLGEKAQPWLEKKWDETFEKTFDTTLGAYLIPTYLDPELIDVTRQNTPFISLLKRETMYGLTVNQQIIDALNTPVFTTEGGTLTTQDESFDRITYTVKYAYSIGTVSGQMRASGKEYIDALQNSIRIHGEALRRFEEKFAILGEDTDSSADPYVFDTNGYDGLFKIVHDYNTASNEMDLAGGASITLTDVRDQIQLAVEAKGKPSLILCDVATYYDLKSQIADWERHVNQVEIAWGMTSYTLDGIPVIWTHSIPTTANEKALAVLDMDVLCMKVLQDVTFEELAKTIDADKFMLKVYETFCDKSGGKFHSTIIGGV